MTVPITGLAKWLIRQMLQDYRLNWVVASTTAQDVLPVPASLEVTRLDEAGLLHIAATSDMQLRKARGYDRLGATGYTLSKDGVPLSVAHFVDLSRYENASVWPLRADEVALLNVVTDETVHGHGYAPVLISNATPMMLSTHYRRAIAFIWWNHRALLRAFSRAGWSRVGFSIEVTSKRGGVRHFHFSVPELWARNRYKSKTSARS